MKYIILILLALFSAVSCSKDVKSVDEICADPVCQEIPAPNWCIQCWEGGYIDDKPIVVDSDEYGTWLADKDNAATTDKDIISNDSPITHDESPERLPDETTEETQDTQTEEQPDSDYTITPDEEPESVDEISDINDIDIYEPVPDETTEYEQPDTDMLYISTPGKGYHSAHTESHLYFSIETPNKCQNTESLIIFNIGD